MDSSDSRSQSRRATCQMPRRCSDRQLKSRWSVASSLVNATLATCRLRFPGGPDDARLAPAEETQQEARTHGVWCSVSEIGEVIVAC